MLINKKGTINPDYPYAKDIFDEEMEVPILAHWVHHKLKGDFLLDNELRFILLLLLLGGLEDLQLMHLNRIRMKIFPIMFRSII